MARPPASTKTGTPIERNIRSFTLPLAAAALLAGCGYSVEQLAEDTEKRRAILSECAEMGVAAKDEEKCRIAAEAEAVAAGNAASSLLKGISE